MDSKRVLKTEISVTTVDDIAYFLIENTAKKTGIIFSIDFDTRVIFR